MELLWGGGEANLTLLGIGVGLVAVSIPISNRVKRDAKKAVDMYNSSLLATSQYKFKPKFNILANGNGIGLSMRF